MSIALQINGIEKAYGSNQVLHDVGFDLNAGEVTVLMGANGAGKSTLVKILSGVQGCDKGTMLLFGAPFQPVSPSNAMAKGVVTVHQSINEGVVPDLDIASNLLLEKLATGAAGFWLRGRSMHQQAQALARSVGLKAMPDTPVHRLSLADRQLVAIARAMAYEPRVLILDEPTSSLSATEANRLFTLIDRFKQQGVAILYISHRMSDIRRIADRIISLRDGRISGEFVDKPLDVEGAVNAMLGRSMDALQLTVSEQQSAALWLQQLCIKPGSKPFDLTVYDGEVIAVTGLVGSGKTAFAETLFGLNHPVSGQMQLHNRAYQPNDAADAIDAGVFLCPRDRSNNALVPDFDLARNITLPFLKRYSRLAWINTRKEVERADTLINDMNVVCQSSLDSIGSLSGGNQQKIAVARWLSEPCRVLLLDEPFQGVDIQARRDIGQQLRETAANRATLVFVSELDEALEVADRIIVIAEHTMVGEHRNEQIDIDLLLTQVASGGNQAAPARTDSISATPTP